MAIKSWATGLALSILLLGAFIWPEEAHAQRALPPVARIVDETGTLTSGQRADLLSKLAAFEQRKGSQIAVVLIPTTQPESIEEFSIRLAEAWKLGRKGVDDGVIVVAALRDKRIRIEVGYGLEGALPDATAKRIIAEVITPHFRNGDFYGGLQDGVDKIISVIDGEKLPEPVARGGLSGGGGNLAAMLLIALILGAIFIRVFTRKIPQARLPFSTAAGGIVGFIVWSLLGSLLVAGVFGIAAAFIAMAMSSASWSTPGSGGFGGFGGGLGGGGFGGSGGGGDTFSSGGGGFGGGGASGDW